MLKYRLLFGSIMIVAFLGLILLDGHLDGARAVMRGYVGDGE